MASQLKSPGAELACQQSRLSPIYNFWLIKNLEKSSNKRFARNGDVYSYCFHKWLNNCPGCTEGNLYLQRKVILMMKKKGLPFSGFESSQTVPGPAGRAI